MKSAFLILSICLGSSGLFSQTVSTLVPTNVGDDLHYAADGFLYSSHYGGYQFRKINPATGQVDTILTVATQTIGAIELDDALNIFTCSYDLGWVGKFVEGDNTITNLATGLSGPAGITHDTNGNLFVATNANHRIIKILPDGAKQTYVQGSPLFWPTGITIDSSGNLFVANMFSGQIIKITPDKQMTVLATLPAISDQTPDLAYLTWVNNKLYICHFDRHVIYEMNPENGDHHVVAGSGQAGNTDGPALTASFLNPTGIAATPSGDTLFITDGTAPNQRLRMLVLETATSSPEIQQGGFVFHRLFPDPPSTILRLDVELNRPLNLTFQVVDAMGKGHLSLPGRHIIAGRQLIELDIENLPAGHWFLMIKSNGFYKSIPFFKI